MFPRTLAAFALLTACDPLQIKPFENAGIQRLREESAAADEENTIPRTLGQFPLVVEHEGLHAAGLQSLDLGHDVVEVIK